MRSIQMTYSVAGNEDFGDFGEHGFYDVGGMTYPLCGHAFEMLASRIGREAAVAEMVPDPVAVESVEDAIEFLRCYGPMAPSNWPALPEDTTWCLIRRGEDDSRTLFFHLNGFSTEDRKEILKWTLG